MLDASVDSPILHITMRCESCQHAIERSSAAARLQGLTGVDRRELMLVIAAGLRAADNQHVLDWFR